MAQTLADIRIPGHRIVRVLGRGGMARVYLAVQESMDREVALKVMLPSLTETDPSFGKRFLQEARIVAKLSHPNIIAVYDVGVADDYHYFTMEYHTGGDLRSRIHDGMMPKLALSITRQIASALAFAHSKGYVHRDVKPENIIFRHDGVAVLTDFGIVKGGSASAKMTATGTVIGTPHYMSPEQAQGNEIDHRSDLYSLGAMLYEMLTGNVPFTGTSALSIGIKHMKEPVPYLASPLNIYQPLLNRFLAKNTADRFQSGDEVMAAIDALSAGVHPDIASASTLIATQETQLQAATVGTAHTGQQGQPPGTSTGASAPKRRWAVTALAVLLPALAFGLYFLQRSAGPTAVVPSAQPDLPERSGNTVDKIALLLASADVATVAGRYLEPPGEGAVHRYRQVLELEPANARAARGLQEIARHYLALSRQAQDTGDLARAEILLKQAAEADPSHPLLAPQRQALNEARTKPARATPSARTAGHKPEPQSATSTALTVANLDTAKSNEAQEREQQLGKLLARVHDLLSPNGLTGARITLAEELNTEASRLAPGDARVKALPAQVANACLKLAAFKAGQKDYKEAEILVRKGLDHSPGHRQLLALQKDIADKQKTDRQTFGVF